MVTKSQNVDCYMVIQAKTATTIRLTHGSSILVKKGYIYYFLMKKQMIHILYKNDGLYRHDK